MSNLEVVRAWKDPDYRSTLSSVPTHPVGEIELADPELNTNAAGFRPNKTMMGHSKFFCGHTFSTHGGCCKA